MQDMTGLGRPQQDNDLQRHTLTVHEVGERLTAAEVPRSERQIKRYCETGFLEAKKVPGPSGEQWFIAPAALPKLIGDLQQWQVQRAGRSQTRPAVTVPVVPEKSNVESADMPGAGRPQPATPLTSADEHGEQGQGRMSGYVQQLEKRIDEKDDVIGLLKGQLTAKDQQITDLSTRFGNLSDRFADTQKLLGAMQRMFAPLLGQADPYAAPSDKPEESVAPDVSTVDNEQGREQPRYNPASDHPKILRALLPWSRGCGWQNPSKCIFPFANRSVGYSILGSIWVAKWRALQEIPMRSYAQ